jgi:hypothetical protein
VGCALYGAGVREPHLGLLRVDVDVDELGRQLEVHDADRVAAGLEHRTVRVGDRARDRAIVDRAAVHEEPQARRAEARALGQAQVGLEPEWAELPRALHELPPRQDLRHALGARLDAQELAHPAAVAGEGDRDAGVRQGDAVDGLAHVSRLRRGAAQELQAGGDVEEQISHRDLGAGRHAARLDSARDRPAPLRRAAGSRGEFEAADRRDAREGLPAKAERLDAGEVLGRAELARRVAHERERELLVRDAPAVVGHDDARDPAAVDLHVDARGLRVDRVLAELLDDAGGSLDHLARCDLVGQLVGQHDDGRAAHSSSSSARSTSAIAAR